MDYGHYLVRAIYCCVFNKQIIFINSLNDDIYIFQPN